MRLKLDDIETRPALAQVCHKLDESLIPSQALWYEALLEHWRLVGKDLGDSFFTIPEAEALPYINDLAGRIHTLCAKQTDLFQVDAHKDLKQLVSQGLTQEKSTQKILEKLDNHLLKQSPAGSESDNTEGLERIHTILPSFHRKLYGRDDELKQLAQALSFESPVTGVAIEAIGGMGKTALARECCLRQEVWKTFDVILGAQALKRQIHINTHASQANSFQLEEFGTVLNIQEYLINLANQLNIHKPERYSDQQLEKEITNALKGKSALIILDNLETIDDTTNILTLFKRFCLSPRQKALITTRRFPADPPISFCRIPLNAISEVAACRDLAINKLQIDIDPSTAPSKAIDAIVEIAQGHPLALELLVGKLITQGPGAIIKLEKEWKENCTNALSDKYINALCSYVFDEKFLEHIGEFGADLLYLIAVEDEGVDEEALSFASGMDEETFNATISKLYQANCIRREFYGDLSVLTMHSLTRSYFYSLQQQYEHDSA